MNTLEAIAKRRSTRAYTHRQIREEELDAILKAGCAAPVAMARYDSLHITVVQTQELLDRVNAVTEEALFKLIGRRRSMDFGARTLIFVSSTPIHRAGTECCNVGIVVENMVLAATDLGVDSVILGAAPAAVAQDEALMKDLGIPEGFRPILGIFLGYGAEDQPAKTHSISVNRV